ncbi:MAG: MgtC/SapB family protein [Patescibacteria group bacterium]
MESILAQIPMFLQLLIATSLGMLIGVERTLAHKTAGLRTYGLVSLGSCLFVLTALTVGQTMSIDESDVMRVVAGIITGIGFLGAGVIILREQTAVGLTTAAGLWVTAGIGVAVGFGLYGLAIATAALTLMTLTVFWYVEHRITPQ